MGGNEPIPVMKPLPRVCQTDLSSSCRLPALDFCRRASFRAGYSHATQGRNKMNRISKIAVTAVALLHLSSGIVLGQTPGGAEARLKEKNIVLPAATPAIGNYVYAVQSGKLLFVSGTISAQKGKVDRDLTIEQGYQAARQAGLTSLARTRTVIGSLDRVKRVVKVVGMVNSSDGFGDQPRVINGFSDLLVDVFGEMIGQHARSAVGMAALPNNAAVEVEVILELE